jgi:hypothetical protein
MDTKDITYWAVSTLFGWVPLLIAILKGKWRTLAILLVALFAFGFFGIGAGWRVVAFALAFTILSIAFTIRLAMLNSLWARWFYSPEKMHAAHERWPYFGLSKTTPMEDFRVWRKSRRGRP